MCEISIIGLGNILDGDMGVGCYILEALAQDNLGDNIRLAYLAEEAIKADVWFYKASLAIIVQGLCLGANPGRILCWNYKTFRQNLTWLTEQSKTIRPLTQALARTELANGFPEKLLFIFIQPKETGRPSISKEMCKAMRRAIKIIKRQLQENGFLSTTTSSKLEPIYRLKLLQGSMLMF
ncbi:hydrogenase maturation protease [Desulfohalobiaceae bacterium Ax17]|uniref:hydrogenase maturation protease n=1 Tax=Desulfovulcanus ferrireducens TaxID=2831190 RepID=UPI00207BB2E3|nr:hydrogenase maturation protease [Desulfovulcanus ferrireducens]MBT8764112.1 hydrogenase maturation protease [Desulfovulcanus ferrireducens]